MGQTSLEFLVDNLVTLPEGRFTANSLQEQRSSGELDVSGRSSGVATGGAGGAIAPPDSILALKKYKFSYVAINAKHEFHETCHSIKLLFNKKRLQKML